MPPNDIIHLCNDALLATLMGGGGFRAAFEVKTLTRALRYFRFGLKTQGILVSNCILAPLYNVYVEFLDMHFESFIIQNLAMHVEFLFLWFSDVSNIETENNKHYQCQNSKEF